MATHRPSLNASSRRPLSGRRSRLSFNGHSSAIPQCIRYPPILLARNHLGKGFSHPCPPRLLSSSSAQPSRPPLSSQAVIPHRLVDLPNPPLYRILYTGGWANEQKSTTCQRTVAGRSRAVGQLRRRGVRLSLPQPALQAGEPAVQFRFLRRPRPVLFPVVEYPAKAVRLQANSAALLAKIRRASRSPGCTTRSPSGPRPGCATAPSGRTTATAGPAASRAAPPRLTSRPAASQRAVVRFSTQVYPRLNGALTGSVGGRRTR